MSRGRKSKAKPTPSQKNSVFYKYGLFAGSGCLHNENLFTVIVKQSNKELKNKICKFIDAESEIEIGSIIKILFKDKDVDIEYKKSTQSSTRNSFIDFPNIQERDSLKDFLRGYFNIKGQDQKDGLRISCGNRSFLVGLIDAIKSLDDDIEISEVANSEIYIDEENYTTLKALINID